ncbi:hypothetical protein Dpoa569_0001242 [Dickeya poaceiphila]|uniref:Uncharacterized protein n=1 Tax=Dickeya poaceiphila TaxID=568768 RepID=A0A5B8I906_9GAMM|nr:hypothetical protein Dpoa569_0001242 [Dickeya poaceiphila]
MFAEKVKRINLCSFNYNKIYMILYVITVLALKHIAFALKRIGKLYSKKQHFVIVRNNHIAGTGLAPVSDGFIHKELRRQPPIK